MQHGFTAPGRVYDDSLPLYEVADETIAGEEKLYIESFRYSTGRIQDCKRVSLKPLEEQEAIASFCIKALTVGQKMLRQAGRD